MGETKFTPGPWAYASYGRDNEYGVGVVINDYGHQLSGNVSHGDWVVGEPVASEVLGEANAALIAAAPDLYDAVEWLYKALNSDPPDGGPQKAVFADDVIYRLDGQKIYVALNKARSALSKARAEPPAQTEGEG